ncbi:MAG: hypothetical protein O2840_04115 [bacterium]|nr:hypothetical protein [bacterium]
MTNGTTTEVKYFFDLDGTIQEGPISAGAIIREMLGRIPGLTNGYLRALAKVKGKELSYLPATEDGSSQNVPRDRHEGRGLNPKAKEMLQELSDSESPIVELAVLTGRSAEKLAELTISELRKLKILDFFMSDEEIRVFMKPSGWSSVEWKMAFLKKQAEKYPGAQLVIVENDVRTAVWVSDMAKELKLKVKAVLLESTETNSITLRLIGSSREKLEEKGIILVKSLDEISKLIYIT